MSFTLIATASRANTTINGFTTTAMSTVGSNLIVISIGSLGAAADPILTDNRGNPYTKASTSYNSFFAKTVFYYVIGSTVSSASHTFTVTGSGTYPTLHMCAFSGATSSSFVGVTGSTKYISGGSVTTGQPGAITPPENDCLLLTSINSFQNDVVNTIDSSYIRSGAVRSTLLSGGNNLNTAMAYKIQTISNAENPTWTINGAATNNYAMSHICFKTNIPSTPPNSGFFLFFL
jgi:hypothetical protein